MQLRVGDDEAVQAVVSRLRVDPMPPTNLYWADHGLTVEDPDGSRVVLIPERWRAYLRVGGTGVRLG